MDDTCYFPVSIPQSGLQAFRPLTSYPVRFVTAGFNPSIGLTSVPTQPLIPPWTKINVVSIPQSGLQAFRHSGGSVRHLYVLSFQSLNRAYKRSDPTNDTTRPLRGMMFQSLNRAYKRSDNGKVRGLICRSCVSIPQSGLQAFRLGWNFKYWLPYLVFQSLNRAYKRSDLHTLVNDRVCNCKFQSLNRGSEQIPNKQAIMELAGT